MTTIPFTYEAEMLNGSIDISIDFKQHKWNLFISGDKDGCYFSYANINIIHLSHDIIKFICKNIMETDKFKIENCWYVEECSEKPIFCKKNIEYF